jgi:hypothetical protein
MLCVPWVPHLPAMNYLMLGRTSLQEDIMGSHSMTSELQACDQQTDITVLFPASFLIFLSSNWFHISKPVRK